MRHILHVMLLTTLAVIIGCEGIGPSMPDLDFKPVDAPTAKVIGGRVADQTPDGARIEVLVELANPNDVPLPLKSGRCSFTVAGQTVNYAFAPNRTIPAKSSQVVPVPVAIAMQDSDVQGMAFNITGSMTYVPPGEMRQLLTESKVPLPSADFSGNGTIQ